MFRLRILFILFLLSVEVGLTGCATVYNPATGKREAILINTETEIDIGKNVSRQVLSEYRVLEDENSQRHIQAIGQRVAAVSDRQDLQYSFTVLDSKELNAFAIPGGGVYINRGLVEKLDDDEIACVLGHEVGHIAARHAVKRIQGQMGYQLLMTVAIVGMSRENAQLARSVSRGTNTIFNLILNGYSRQDELLADKLAIKYARKADYDAWAMITSLKKLQAESKEGSPLPALVIFRSHPYLADRIAVLETELATPSQGPTDGLAQ